jgi:hypothetical protein
LLPIGQEGSAVAQLMTLLAAAQSLQLIELVGVSWINVHPGGAHPTAEFTIALLLPFLDPALSSELRSGGLRFWADQTRLLQSKLPVREQIDELHESGVLGDLAFAYQSKMWIIKTHAGHELERRAWLRAIVALEGRRPLV